MYIESLTNAHVKEWVKLKNKKYRDETGLFLIEGDHLINEARKKNIIKEIITIDKNEKADYYVTPDIMKKISNQISISDSVAVCYKIKEQTLSDKIIILDDIQDPGNLGTIIRSCVAFNFNTIILSEGTVDIYNDKVIRASEGMIFHVNVIRKNLKEVIKELHNKNYSIMGTQLRNGENIKNINISNEKIAIVMGNEGQGIKKEILDKCDKYVYIPMTKNCESLNVGVATSIILYELFK